LVGQADRDHAGGSVLPSLPHPGRTPDPVRRDVDIEGDATMRLSRPKVVTWWIAVILGVLGLLAHNGVLAAWSAYAFWLVLVGLVLLILGTLLKDL
jgi:hypothetical protein